VFSTFNAAQIKIYIQIWQPLRVHLCKLKHCIFHTPFQNSQDKAFQVSNVSLWFGWSVCKSAKFQLPTLLISGLAFGRNMQTKIPSSILNCQSKMFCVSYVLFWFRWSL
jgi:hypothetical protein